MPQLKLTDYLDPEKWEIYVGKSDDLSKRVYRIRKVGSAEAGELLSDLVYRTMLNSSMIKAVVSGLEYAGKYANAATKVVAKYQQHVHKPSQHTMKYAKGAENEWRNKHEALFKNYLDRTLENLQAYIRKFS